MKHAARAAALAIALVAGTGASVGAQTEPVIHVGASPFEAQADVYYALELGLFKRAGLNVDVQQYPGGSAIVAAIAGGALQIGAGNPLPLAQARQRGIRITLISPGYLYDATTDPPIDALMVAAKSSLRSAKDLNGKTIAVTGVRGLDQIAAFMWIDRNGGDSSTVKTVEIPQTIMPDAVADGRVDAAMISDPALTAGVNDGKIRLFGNAYGAIGNHLIVAAWFATDDWAAKNPVAVRKFAAAINEGSAWAEKNPEAAAAVQQKYLRVTTTKAREFHARTLDPAFIQPILDGAVRFKIIEPFKASELIWKG